MIKLLPQDNNNINMMLQALALHHSNRELTTLVLKVVSAITVQTLFVSLCPKFDLKR